MTKIQAFFSSAIQLNLIWVLIIALLYVLIHSYRHKSVNQILDIYVNYIPVLTHEFGHILFNKISGGKAKDLVIVANPTERRETSQQGFAITQSKSRVGQAITTFGGYIMPPFMLFLGFLALEYQYPSLFISAYLFIFIYFLVITSRKLFPIFIVILLITFLYFLLQTDNQYMMLYIVAITYHFILGVLLGEVLQSSWTILNLTFSRQPVSWDGTTLKELTHLPTTLFSCIWIAINLFTIYQLFQSYVAI
ncbi:M50 family metallopeptidase [Staphylococcus edaphicus]|uniref:M50 family metallopeptidase n=1 Tax=Staphylococcus edaphicus TaxID=1955013 RepID=A0A2C6WI37_9STAP|nr:M50 family metallopeptidase [Staphylococcus edaphicus]PHK50458.1 hypothetical protein BTJ66_03120 [Staphylococcus edaphicus]UQW81142.1 M50 family metallopeptidase [Staphylococcus edaphicus]